MGTKWLLSIFETDNLINSLTNSYLLATFTTLATIAITLPVAYVLGTSARLRVGWPAAIIEIASNLPLCLSDHRRRAWPDFALRGDRPFRDLYRHRARPHDHGRALCPSRHGRLLPPGPPEYEEAARNLGATRLYVIRHIYLPLVWRGVLAAAIFAFSWSLNEFVLVLMLGFPDIETIPVQIYQFVGGYYLHPQKAAALGLFLLIPALILMYVVERLLQRSTVVPAGA